VVSRLMQCRLFSWPVALGSLHTRLAKIRGGRVVSWGVGMPVGACARKHAISLDGPVVVVVVLRCVSPYILQPAKKKKLGQCFCIIQHTSTAF
jgi:hypothetical protein